MIRTAAILSLFVFGLTACGALMRAGGKVCPAEIYTQQRVNLGARTEATIGKEIYFCKGGTSPKAVKVSMPIYPMRPDSTLSLTTLYEMNHEGEIRYDGSCNDNGRKKYKSETVPVALTSKSFSEFKLCYYDAQKKVVALSLTSENEPCPAGSFAQEEPVDDCSQLH